jgi:hypothetical protein
VDMRRARHPNMSAKLLISRLSLKLVYLETMSIAAEIPRDAERALVQMMFKGGAG